MSELAIDEPDATIVTDFAYDQTNTEQKILEVLEWCFGPQIRSSFYVSNYLNFIFTYFLYQ